MLSAVPHRGPRLEAVTHGACALGVSNPTDSNHSSVTVGEGIAVAFTGLLDNADELAREIRPPPAVVPLTPARIVQAAFLSYGHSAAARLRGTFAVVVTDGLRLWCFRDHVGFAGLFYRNDPRGIFVASEAKQVVAGAGIRKEPDLGVLERAFFRVGDRSEPAALRGVDRLRPAAVLESDGASLRVSRYWEPERLLETARPSKGELRERFLDLMSQATARTLTGADAVSLSGGIDSPAVAAFAAPRHLELTGRPLRALSAVYPGLRSVDERPYIEEVAERFGLPLQTYEQKADPLGRLREWTQLIDGPPPSGSMAMYEDCYRRAREYGAATLLTGEHAEFLCAMGDYLLPHLLVRGRVFPLVRQLRARRATGASRGLLARQLASSFVPGAVAAARWRSRRDGVPGWLDHRKVAEGNPLAGWSGRRWRRLQLAVFEPGGGLEADEVCQDVCGVRARRPWADVDLWEFFLSLPAEMKFPHPTSKALVKELLRGTVPDSVLDRRKTYFDEAIERSIDSRTLRRWLSKPATRLSGVDYQALNARLSREDLSVNELIWAKDLAGVHAFLSQWE
jgi:asparagine synthase (glutamine-hydrolysing)